MSEEHIYVWIPRTKIVTEQEDRICADLGDAESLLKMCLAAMSNPGQGVTRKDEE